MTEKKRCSKLLFLEEVKTYSFSLFVGHGFFQNAGCSCRCYHALCCLTSLKITRGVAKSAVAIIQVVRFPVRKLAAANLIERVLNMM